MKKLIINADDFGYDRDTFEATTALLTRETVRSATILVGFPQTQAAIKFARNADTNLSFGLHFNIAEGRPLASRSVPSLVNRSGEFRGAIPQRIRAICGLLAPADIAAECEAQLAILRDSGLTISHIDSHGHFHKFPTVLKALMPVLSRFGIARVRRAQTLYDNPTFYNRALDAHCNRTITNLGAGSDHFFNTRSHSPDWLQAMIQRLPLGSTEIGIHPGTDDDWRRSEMQPFLDGDVRSWIESQGISIISYHDVSG